MNPTDIIRIVEIGGRAIVFIYQLVEKAVNGDADARRVLERVDEVLSESSPTEAAFARANEIAAGKPPAADDA